MPLLVQCVAFKESSIPNENVEGNLWRLKHALQKTKQQSLLGIWRSRGWVLCAFPLSPSAARIEQTRRPNRDVVLKLVSCVKELHERLICIWPRDLLESIIVLSNTGRTIRLSGAGVFQATNRVEFRPDKDLHSLIEICQRVGWNDDGNLNQVNSVKELEERLWKMHLGEEEFNPFPDEETSDSLLLLSWCHSVIHHQVEELIADAIIQQGFPNGDSSSVFKSIELLSTVMTSASSTVEYRQVIVDLETRRLVISDVEREKQQQQHQQHQPHRKKKNQSRKRRRSKETTVVGLKKSTAQPQQEQVLPGGQLTMALTAFLMRAAGGGTTSDSSRPTTTTTPTATTTASLFDSSSESEGITDDDDGGGDEDEMKTTLMEPMKGIDHRLQSLYSSLLAMEQIVEPRSESFETICSSSSPCVKQFLLQCDEVLSAFGGFPRSLRRRVWAMIAMIRMETPFKEILLHEYELAKTEVEEIRQSAFRQSVGAVHIGPKEREEMMRQSGGADHIGSNEREEMMRQSGGADHIGSNEREETMRQSGGAGHTEGMRQSADAIDDIGSNEREEMRQSGERTQVEMWNPFTKTTMEETKEISTSLIEPTTIEEELLLTNNPFSSTVEPTSDNQEMTTMTTTTTMTAFHSEKNELNPLIPLATNPFSSSSVKDLWDRLRQVEYQLDKDLPRCHRYHPGVISSSDAIQRLLTAWQMMTTSSLRLVDPQEENNCGGAARGGGGAATIIQPLERTYWQGLDSVCAVFLLAMELNEIESFAMLRLWTDIVMKGEVYVVDAALKGINQLERGVMEELSLVDPELFRHLIKDLEMDPKWFLLPWVLAGFAHGVLPIGDALFKLFDWFILGKTTVVEFSLAVLIQTRGVLLKLNDAGDVKLFLSRLPAISPDALVNEGLRICEYKSRLLFPFAMHRPPPPPTELRFFVEETTNHSRFAKLVSGSYFFSNNDEIKRSTMIVARRGDKSSLSTLDLSGCSLTFMDDRLFGIESFDRMRDGQLVVQSLMRGEYQLKQRKCIGIVCVVGMNDSPSVEFARELWELLVVYHSVAHVFVILISMEAETEPQGDSMD